MSQSDSSAFPQGATPKRRFHLIGVGLPRTGTTSLARIFASYKTKHEYALAETLERLVALHDGRLSRDCFRAYIVGRDRSSSLEMDSSTCVHFYLDLLVELFPEAHFVNTLRDCRSWLNSYLNMLVRWRKDVGTRPIPHWQCEYGRLQLGHFDPDHFLDGDAVRAHLPELAGRLLRYWGVSCRGVLKRLPAERSVTIRTDQLSDSLDILASIAGVPESSLRADQRHVNRDQEAIDFLGAMQPNKLERAIAKYCQDVMDRFF